MMRGVTADWRTIYWEQIRLYAETGSQKHLNRALALINDDCLEPGPEPGAAGVSYRRPVAAADIAAVVVISFGMVMSLTGHLTVAAVCIIMWAGVMVFWQQPWKPRRSRKTG